MTYLLEGLLVLLLIVIGLSFFLSWFTLRPRRRKKKKSPADLGLLHEDVKFRSGNAEMAGWLVKAPNSKAAPTVVFVHGWESNAQGMLQHAEYLFDLGTNLFFYDARGHGDSGPANYMSLVRMSEDLENALNHLQSRNDIDPARLILFGHSMGAATAITVAARKKEIAAVIANSGFANFKLLTTDMLKSMHLPYYPIGALMMLFWKIRLKIRIADWNPSNSVRSIDKPLFLAHGDADEVVSIGHLGELAQNAPAATTLRVNGAMHRNLHENEVFRHSVRQFVKTASAGESAAA